MGWSFSKLNCAVGRGAELHAASSSPPYHPQPPPCSSDEEKKMIESHGNLRTERREKTPAGAQVNIKTDNCSYLHTDSRRQHQTDLERRTLEHNGEEEEKKTQPNHRVAFRHTASRAKQLRRSRLWWARGFAPVTTFRSLVIKLESASPLTLHVAGLLSTARASKVWWRLQRQHEELTLPSAGQQLWLSPQHHCPAFVAFIAFAAIIKLELINNKS